MLIVWFHFRSAATKMANSGMTSEAMKHKFGWKSERMTSEYVSGSRAALIANANALTCAPVQNGQPAGRQVVGGPQPAVPQPPRQQPSVSINYFLHQISVKSREIIYFLVLKFFFKL